jgi:hypothetical protein
MYNKDELVRKEFTDEEIDKLLCRLMEYDLDVLRKYEDRFTNKKDIENLRKVYAVRNAVGVLIEYMGEDLRKM